MKTIIKMTTGLLATAAFATAAQANVDQDKINDDKSDTRIVKTIDAQGQVGQLTILSIKNDDNKTAVLGAFEVQNTDAYIVENNAGDLFINHLIPVEDLPDPTLSVQTEDTYTFEYNGRTYTNRIIRSN